MEPKATTEADNTETGVQTEAKAPEAADLAATSEADPDPENDDDE